MQGQDGDAQLAEKAAQQVQAELDKGIEVPDQAADGLFFLWLLRLFFLLFLFLVLLFLFFLFRILGFLGLFRLLWDQSDFNRPDHQRDPGALAVVAHMGAQGDQGQQDQHAQNDQQRLHSGISCWSGSAAGDTGICSISGSSLRDCRPKVRRKSGVVR